MGPAGHTTVQIEGKIFDLAVVGDGDFVRIVEKGRRKGRMMEVPLNWVRWVWSVLGSAANTVVGSVAYRRFGRLDGWFKVRSNSKGRFLELGISGKGDDSLVFVPGSSMVHPWADFRAALGRVVGGDGGSGGQRARGGKPTPRSYRDAAIFGARGADRQPTAVVEETVKSGVSVSSLEESLEAVREEARHVAREEATKMVQQVAAVVAREVARAVASEVAREIGRVTACENGKMLTVLQEMIRGISEAFANGFGLLTALKGGDGNQGTENQVPESGLGSPFDGGLNHLQEGLIPHKSITFEGSKQGGCLGASPNVVVEEGEDGMGCLTDLEWAWGESDGLNSEENSTISSDDEDGCVGNVGVWNDEVDLSEEGCVVNGGGLDDEVGLPFDSLWDSVLEVVGDGSGADVLVGEKAHHGGPEDVKRGAGCTVDHDDSRLSCPREYKVGEVIMVKDDSPSPFSDPLNGFEFGSIEVNNEMRHFLYYNGCLLIPKSLQGRWGRNKVSGNLVIDKPSLELEEGLLMLGLLKFG